MGKDRDEIRQEIEETRDRMGDTVDAIAYKADVPSRMQDAVSDRVESVRSTITGTVGVVRDRLTDAVPDARDLARASRSTVSAMRENPLGLLFGSAAIGFLLGSVLPSTNVENERLGDFGDRLKQTAQSTGGEIVTQGKAVVKDTIDAAKQAATQSALQHGADVAQTAAQSLGAQRPEGAEG